MPEETELKINIITKRMHHHAGNSGYDKLLDYIKTKNVFSVDKLTLGQRVIGRLCSSLINESDSIWYHRKGFIAELSAAKYWLSKKIQIFHFLYGENSYNYLSYMKLFNKSNKIICTYHLPEERFNEIINNRSEEHTSELQSH